MPLEAIILSANLTVVDQHLWQSAMAVLSAAQKHQLGALLVEHPQLLKLFSENLRTKVEFFAKNDPTSWGSIIGDELKSLKALV